MSSFLDFIVQAHIYKIGFSFMVATTVDKLFNSIFEKFRYKKDTVLSNFINLMIILIIGYIIEVTFF